MPIDANGRNQLQEFYKAIEPWEVGYERSSFSYVAVREGEDFIIVQAVLWLNTIESKFPFTHYEFEQYSGRTIPPR